MEDQNNQNPEAPQQTNTTVVEQSAVGPTIALIVIILILLVGGLYFWSQNQGDTTERPARDDEVNSIEADIEASNLDATESDLDDVDAAFDAEGETTTN